LDPAVGSCWSAPGPARPGADRTLSVTQDEDEGVTRNETMPSIAGRSRGIRVGDRDGNRVGGERPDHPHDSGFEPDSDTGLEPGSAGGRRGRSERELVRDLGAWRPAKHEGAG